MAMPNRNPTSPILFAITLSLAASSCFAAKADDANKPNQGANAALPSTATPLPLPTEGATTYTVVTGDSLWLIAHKFHCSVNALKKANNLTKNNLKPGQTLQIPAGKSKAEAEPTPTPKTTFVTPQSKPVTHHPVVPTEQPESTAYLRAQPVQDCDVDVPASTFASCPTPPSASDSDTVTPDAPAPAPIVVEKPARRAELVSLAELNQAAPATKETAAAGSPVISTAKNEPPAIERTTHSLDLTSQGDWGKRFLQEAHELGNKGIEYDESWRPPGESQSWDMDCSNTSRYIYKITTGIQLPRTASDQYYYLHLQNKAWDVPQAPDGFADCHYLRENLKPGDLLFWENTYKPERQPPITHVMVFLGTNEKGQWIMAGSQSSRGGLHNRSHGGPDIYVFDPTKPCGGYSTWMGMVRHQGRFCAFGRPLDADRSKLAVAAND